MKLFIFFMIAYFYDTHLKPDGGTRRWGDGENLRLRNSECGMGNFKRWIVGRGDTEKG